MIDKLKKKFIKLSMVSLFVLLLLMVVGMNAISYGSMIQEADNILSFLSEHQGKFPELGEMNNMDDTFGRGPGPIPDHITKETPYESRYFTVTYTDDGQLLQVETSRIASVDSNEAVQYAETILSLDKNKGFIDKFRFLKSSENDTLTVIFLDWGKKIDSFQVFLAASSGMALIGFLIVFFIICHFSEKFVRPMAESYEKQKRFITDAGHEMRTPLTIINANADILEMEIGENESLDDIKQQAVRLSNLTKELVKLARMEEAKEKIQMVDFPISDVVSETLSTFFPVAQSQNKDIVCDIVPLLSMTGNSQSIEQLVSILLENALKYSPENTSVHVSLKKDNKHIILRVKNTVLESIEEKDLKNIFERFYRADSSRNSEKGGYGIGLSIAKAIVDSHNGKIYAKVEDSNDFVISAIF